MKTKQLFEDEKRPRCRVCKRPLTNPDSMKKGVGKKCEKRVKR